MKSNSKVAMEPPFDLNPLIHIWRTINASWVLTHSFLEYLKLPKITIVHVLSSVKGECCFSSLAFFKNKLWATLDLHLPLVVGMYNQKFYILKTFHMLLHLMLGLEQHITMVYCVDDTYGDMLSGFFKATQLLAPSYLVNFLQYWKLDDVFSAIFSSLVFIILVSLMKL